jgi:CO/xanthine dehydrogenase Mo-binding subunit
VGRKQIRHAVVEKVTGRAKFASDVHPPGMLYGVIIGSPHPRAKVKSVDTSAAKNMPGVFDVIDASTPETKGLWLGSYTNDKIKLPMFNPEISYQGQPVAAVAAETPYQASDAARAVKVEYEVLPPVSDIEDALKPGAPIIHGTDNKITSRTYERGDLNKGFAEADVVLEENYTTPCVIHNTLERHGSVAVWNGDYVTFYNPTQGVYNDRDAIAGCLGLPFTKVRVICPYSGGNFGSRLEGTWQHICAAIMAKRTGRPVKLFLSREDDYLDAGNRPPSVTKMKIGAKNDGTLTALEYIAYGTGGPVDHGGIFWRENMIKDLYLCPNLRTVCTDVATNAGLSRPMRAPDYPQQDWAMEQIMDALAEKLNMCPVELRLKNIPALKQDVEGNPPWSTQPLKELLTEGAKAFGWKQARERTANQKGHIRRGVGVAASDWELGNGWLPGTVVVRMYADGTTNMNTGITEIGGGSPTAMAMVVAEELGLNMDYIEITNGDTGTTQWSDISAGSKTMAIDGVAARDAAIKVKQQLYQFASDELKVPFEDLTMRGGVISSTSDPSKKIKVTDLSYLKNQKVVVGVGIRHPQPAAPCKPFTVQFCEVEVNTKTGMTKVVRFLSSNDPGRVMNLLTINNQTDGGIALGIGFGLSENRIMDRGQTGRQINRNMNNYKVPTILDVPMNIVSIYPGPPDLVSNWNGSKGWGEPPCIPGGAAIANAIYNATGVRFYHSPITPMKIKA